MSADRRLIEHRLPLREISEASAKEKSIRHGHISTLHIWWARRPLAASRAAVFGTLVPDTEENYELVKRIVPWEAVKDGNSADILEARRRVLEAHGGRPPRVLDPFAGGGAIPLEALRLGCEAYALDLNPVAFLILKATLEYPQRFGQPNSRPVPPYILAKDREGASKDLLREGEEGPWARAYRKNPLAAEVRYWGEWVLERAKAELAGFYPQGPDGRTPVAYLWARTVTCTNPACRAEVPLVRQWWLARRERKRVALKPLVDREAKRVDFQVVEVPEGEDWPDQGTVQRGNAVCPVCGATVDNAAIRQQGTSGRMGQRMLAVVVATPGGKYYRLPVEGDLIVYRKAEQHLGVVLETLGDFFALEGTKLSPLPNEPINVEDKRNFWVGEYGPKVWGQLFNPRQALALLTFAKWVREAHAEMLRQGMEEELARAVGTFIALALDRVTDYTSALCTWVVNGEFIGHTFVRQALPMVWDYVEAVPISSVGSGLENALDWVVRVVEFTALSSYFPAVLGRASATHLPFEDNFFDAIITDPPYYDAVPYADLSDFFYVWLRRTVGHLYPEHFRTPLTPKAQEIVQNPVRHGGDNEKAKRFFEEMMAQAFREMHRVLKPGGRATVVFAHKSTEAWETLIGALIRAGFQVEASWPLHTEMQTRLRARGSAALASSTFLACRKREGQEVGYFREVREEMERAILPRLEEFWQAGIRGADFFMSAIGPGLEAFSRYAEVRRMDGTPVDVGAFLDEVRRIVLRFVLAKILGNGGREGSLDEPTQFALLALWSYGYELPSDEARKLAQSTGVELHALGSLVRVEGEKTRLQKAKERAKRDPDFGLPRPGARVPVVDALQRAVLLLPKGRQALAEYLSAVDHLKDEPFWMAAQAFAEVLEGEDEGRALHELLTYREALPRMVQDRLL